MEPCVLESPKQRTVVMGASPDGHLNGDCSLARRSSSQSIPLDIFFTGPMLNGMSKLSTSRPKRGKDILMVGL
jgi:hypothetical protein